MHVVTVALSVRGAMGQYAASLASALAKQVSVTLVVPQHFDVGHLQGKMGIMTFRTGATRIRAGLEFLNLWKGRELADSIRNLRPSAVHLLNSDGYPWAPILAQHLADVPFFVTVHDPVPHSGDLVGHVNQTVSRLFTLRHARGVHVHSEAFRCHIRKAGVADDRIYVIPLGTFAHYYLPYRDPAVSRERMALFFGRIQSYKGVDVLVQAGLLLRWDETRKLRVAIAGAGKLPRRTYRVIKANPDLFELHNRYLSDREVAGFFQRAAVCVLPYLDATQSAIPSIAAAFGVPVVASSVGAFVEDVPYYGGLLVPPGEPKALAETMLMAVGCPVKNETCRTWDQLAASFISMYARQRRDWLPDERRLPA